MAAIAQARWNLGPAFMDRTRAPKLRLAKVASLVKIPPFYALPGISQIEVNLFAGI
jgi:hypothetical protein